MNKKILMFALIPLVLSVMGTPAMAKSIGPQRAAGKNPHIMITPEGVELVNLTSGVVNSWTNDTEIGVFDFMHILDASKAKIRNAFNLTIEDLMQLMTNKTAALEAENKWGYISYDVLVEMFILEGYSEAEAIAMASMWPEGIYAMFVNVGK